MNASIGQSGVATAYGWGLEALWDGLLSGKTAIRPTQRFAEQGFVSDQVALVPDLEVGQTESRAMAMLAKSLAPLIGKIDPMTPLILATTVGEIEFIEQSVLDSAGEAAADARPQILLARIKELLDLRGPAVVVSSACASSAAALTRAASMVRRGDVKDVLVVACDAVSEFVYSGFSTLMSLCDKPARPFDAERGGLTLGEAAAWAIVTSDKVETRDSATILGWGSTTDAVHMTAPDRNARGLSRAISKACKMTSRDASHIAFIAAHGTATIYSDAMELVAFQNAIGEARPIFSVKGGIGHTLGAAGLVQVLVTARALERGVVPPTVGLRQPDPAAIGWAHASPIDLTRGEIALSTNSGFGGVNTAVLLGRNGAL